VYRKRRYIARTIKEIVWSLRKEAASFAAKCVRERIVNSHRPPHRRFRSYGESFARPRGWGYRYLSVVVARHLIESVGEYWISTGQLCLSLDIVCVVYTNAYVPTRARARGSVADSPLIPVTIPSKASIATAFSQAASRTQYNAGSHRGGARQKAHRTRCPSGECNLGWYFRP